MAFLIGMFNTDSERYVNAPLGTCTHHWLCLISLWFAFCSGLFYLKSLTYSIVFLIGTSRLSEFIQSSKLENSVHPGHTQSFATFDLCLHCFK